MPRIKRPLLDVSNAEDVSRLVDGGVQEERVAVDSGCTRRHIGNVCRLSRLPNEAREMVSRGDISATTALRAFQKLPNCERCLEVLRHTIEVAHERGMKKASWSLVERLIVPASVARDTEAL